MSTHLPIGLKRRVNLFVATTSPEEDVNYDNNNQDDFVIQPAPLTRTTQSPTVDRLLNTNEKIIFAVFSIVVFFGQVITNWYFWNQTENKILLFWGVHQVALLVISLIIMFKTKFMMTFIGPRKTMCAFDYLVEYEKSSAIVYHSFQFGQVFYNFFARGILNAECIYHTITFICVIAFLCRSKKYNI